MEYKLKISDETYNVTADGKEGVLALSIGENNHNVDYRVVSENHIHLTVDGRSVNAYICDGPEGKLISINGVIYNVIDVDALEQSGSRKRVGDDLPDVITPQMPSVVVSVLVNEGDEVTRGQGVIVLSAMKMETTLSSPFDGKVTKVNAAEGDKVMPGHILVEIEPSVKSEAAEQDG